MLNAPTNAALLPVPANHNNDHFDILEKELAEAVTSFHLLVSDEPNKKKKPDALEAIPEVNQESRDVTLETVAENMTGVLNTLRENLDQFQMKTDSFSDVPPKLEKLWEKRKERQVQQQQVNKDAPAAAGQNNKGKLVKQPQQKQPQQKQKRPAGNSSVGSSKPSSQIKARVQQQPKVINCVSSQQSKPQQRSQQQLQRPKTLPFPPVSISRENYDPLGIIREEVKRAMKEGKTFTIRGNYPEIRRALLRRGWIEKLHHSHQHQYNSELSKLFHFSIPELVKMVRNKELSDKCRRMAKSKMMEGHQVDLYWTCNFEAYKEISDKVKMTKINKIRRKDDSFTNKKGLSDSAKQIFLLSNTTTLNHPRTYSLVKNGGTKAFVDDFNITAAMSLLKWIQHNSVSMESKIVSPSGKIPINIFDFAVTECYRFIKKAQEKDPPVEVPEAFETEWSTFLENFYKIVHIGNHFKQTEDVSLTDMLRKVEYIMDKLREIWPFLEMDGLMNIWILKPVSSSQGVGIHMCRTMRYVLNVVKNNPNRRYVIQKYIERPLLIYNTKFDIRQWFLISSTSPLTIWMYKTCYLRFSSQTYNVRKLHESIHLTNNSVQRKYNQQGTSRDIALPHYNMWDSDQFINHLSNIGYPRVFDDVIFPGMRQCIISSVLLHQKKLDSRRNTFELYGADFIITEDFKPWLLEINSSPALHASTPVTARMCPAVLEDVVKVVVDRAASPKSSTGRFQMIYKGFQVAKPTETVAADEAVQEDDVRPIVYTRFYRRTNPAICIKQIGMEMKKTLQNLLELLKRERERRRALNHQSIETSDSLRKVMERHVSMETIMSITMVQTQTQIEEESGEVQKDEQDE